MDSAHFDGARLEPPTPDTPDADVLAIRLRGWPPVLVTLPFWKHRAWHWVSIDWRAYRWTWLASPTCGATISTTTRHWETTARQKLDCLNICGRAAPRCSIWMIDFVPTLAGA